MNTIDSIVSILLIAEKPNEGCVWGDTMRCFPTYTIVYESMLLILFKYDDFEATCRSLLHWY